MLLLCTDGLTDAVEDAEIIQAVRGLDIKSAAQALVDLACARNARDNITVVMMLVPPGQVGTYDYLRKKKARAYWQWALLGLAGLILLALFLAGQVWVGYRFIHPLISILLPSP